MKFMNQARKYGVRVGATVAAATLPLVAFAGGGPDYSGITDAIVFDDIEPLVIGAAGALIALFVVIKGVRIVMGFVGR